MKRILIFFYFLLIFIKFFADDSLTQESIFSLSKNPVKAGLLSAVIPGAGQIYNEKYIKASTVVAIQAGLVGMTLYHDKKMKDYKEKVRISEGIAKIEYQVLYRDYYDKRQSYIFWVGASVFLSAIDAFVDAHLYDFNDKKNEVKLRFSEEKLTLSISF